MVRSNAVMPSSSGGLLRPRGGGHERGHMVWVPAADALSFCFAAGRIRGEPPSHLPSDGGCLCILSALVPLAAHVRL